MAWMEDDLPKRFSELVAKEEGKGDSLGKRPIEDKPTNDDGKPSIKDRIKVRDDAKDKRIKVAAVLARPPNATTDSPADDTQPKGDGEGRSKKDPSKVRCNFYPGCNKPDCPFVHPKEPCPKFPTCAFGNKCIYIHPSINCRYGIMCQRPNCAYVHPSLMTMMGQQNNRGGRPGGFPFPFQKGQNPRGFPPSNDVNQN